MKYQGNSNQVMNLANKLADANVPFELKVITPADASISVEPGRAPALELAIEQTKRYRSGPGTQAGIREANRKLAQNSPIQGAGLDLQGKAGLYSLDVPPVNTTEPGKRIPVAFSDPEMQRAYDAGEGVFQKPL